MTQTVSMTSEMPDGRSLDSSELEERLEQGQLIHFFKCPFGLPEGDDLKFLLSQNAFGAKSISFYPKTRQLVGHRSDQPGDDERLSQLLRAFNQASTDWLSRALPRYHSAMRFGPLRLRTEEEEGRTDLDPRFSGSVLHVDMSSDAPAHGDSFLRIFVNINPTKSRHWITSDSLEPLLNRWGNRVRQPDERKPGLLQQLKIRYGHALGFGVPENSSYHELMSRLHFFGKTDDYLQNLAPRKHWEFSPGSAWVVFSDITSHAVLGGRYAIDQTYLVPGRAFKNRSRSTKSILERFWDRRLTTGALRAPISDAPAKDVA